MTLINYVFQVNSFLIIFYLFYKLLLERETFFVFNRAYLISAVALSFAIPCMPFQELTGQTVNQNISIDIETILAKANPVPDGTAFDWGRLVLAVYLTGILLSSAFLFYKLYIIRKTMSNPENGSAFSFFNFKTIDNNLPGSHIINIHEETHIKQLHSLDVLFFEIAAILIWFNPVIYWYKNSIKIIHEYLADEQAAKYQGDKRSYALLLLSKAMGVLTPTLANSFINQSLVKKRIYMLQRKKSKKIALTKYVLLVPLLSGLTILSAATIKNSNVHWPVAMYDHQPEFPGGINKFAEYLKKSVKYPQEARKNKTQGKVLVSFVVDTDGSLTNAAIVKGLGNGLDEEALRVISNCPSWHPGYRNNAPVRVQYNMNINFSLNRP